MGVGVGIGVMVGVSVGVGVGVAVGSPASMTVMYSTYIIDPDAFDT